MVIQPHSLERQLVEQFIETLRGLPDVHPSPPTWESANPTKDGRADAQVDLMIAGKSVRILIEAKKAVYPRDVREILWQLRKYSGEHLAGDYHHETLSLLVAESISPGAKDLLRNDRVGYYDSGGSLFLPARGAYLYVDKPPPKTLVKSLRSLFTGRRAQVLNALLVRRRDWFRGKELADEAHVSPATASEVLTELERFDWVVSRGQGPSKERHVQDPAALLDAWANHISAVHSPAMRRYFMPSLQADRLLEVVARVFSLRAIEYAISYEAAAQRYAPYLTSVSQVRCRLLPSQAVDAALVELGARVVGEGANLAIIETKSPGELLFRECIDDVWLASPIQVYLDLLRGEGRAKEMAAHLRKQRIGF
jgi:hypothetical protein